MKNTKYIPGPWEWSETWNPDTKTTIAMHLRTRQAADKFYDGVVLSVREDWIGYMKDDVGRANANLIATAPELLEALEKAYDDIIHFLNEGDFKRKIEWDAGYIVDAIKKAKGE